MPSAARKPELSKTRNVLSMLLFAVAGVLLIVAIYLFWQDRNQDQTPAAPTAVPGRAQLNNVHDALDEAGLTVEYGRDRALVDELSPPGQQLLIDDLSAFVFIFTDPDERESEMSGVAADEIELVDSSGDAVTSNPLTVAEGSNVVVIVAGADDEMAARIADAVATIP